MGGIGGDRLGCAVVVGAWEPRGLAVGGVCDTAVMPGGRGGRRAGTRRGRRRTTGTAMHHALVCSKRSRQAAGRQARQAALAGVRCCSAV